MRLRLLEEINVTKDGKTRNSDDRVIAGCHMNNKLI